MKKNRLFSSSILSIGIATALLSGCQFLEDYLNNPGNGGHPSISNYSVTPPLLKVFPEFNSVKVMSLISSDDTLKGSPNFVFGGSADGIGWLKTEKGFMAVVNHEDNFAVSRINFDRNLKPIKGEYILNSDAGQWRLCSGSLATPKVHGFGPLFITCGESGQESRIHGLNPNASASDAAVSRELPAFGRWSSENALPLPKSAYPGKTAIIIGDDDSPGNGQLVMYLSNTVGDLNGGSIYALKRKDGNQREMDIVEGTSLDVEFVKLENQATLTGAQIDAQANEKGAIQFGRVEDLDYRKGKNLKGRELYFNVTGKETTADNGGYKFTKYGRVYKLVLDSQNPLKGKLELVLNGDDRSGKAKLFQNPDNIMVTENYAYIQEDPNGYGDETHDSYIYQYNFNTKELKVVMELDHRRDKPDAAKYNTTGPSRLGSWEYGALEDISELVGLSNTFSLCVQPHSWKSDRFKGVDGGTKRLNENQGSQIVILKGLPK